MELSGNNLRRSVAKAAKGDIKKTAKGKADQVLFSSDLLVKLGQVLTKKLRLSILDSAREQLEKLSAGMEVMQGNLVRLRYL